MKPINNGSLKMIFYVMFMVLTMGIALYAAVRGPATEAQIEYAINEHAKSTHPLNRELFFSKADGEVLKAELRNLQEKMDKLLTQQEEVLWELRSANGR